MSISLLQPTYINLGKVTPVTSIVHVSCRVPPMWFCWTPLRQRGVIIMFFMKGKRGVLRQPVYIQERRYE